jgi:hypothetical protein
MYCDNNAIDFVQVAKDLLEKDDGIVMVSSSDISLTVRRSMASKKLNIRNKYGADASIPGI